MQASLGMLSGCQTIFSVPGLKALCWTQPSTARSSLAPSKGQILIPPLHGMTLTPKCYAA